MFITPLLSECHRIAGTMYEENDKYKRPIITAMDDTSILYQYREEDTPLKSKVFKHPYFGRHGNKAESLPQLLKNNDNIVSTHQLFVNLTPEILKQASNHILIIDEMLSIYEIYTEFNKEEVLAMFKNKWISIDPIDNISLRFHREYYGNFEEGDDPTLHTYYETFATLCDLNQLMWIDEKVIIWELAIETLTAFKEVWICTYMFEKSFMSSYLNIHNIPYEIIKFGKKPSEIKHLISIYEDTNRSKLNAIGETESALSVSYSKQPIVKQTLSSNLDNFVRTKAKCKKSDFLWTCFKDAKTTVQKNCNNDYSKQFLPFNTKATNEYGHIHNVAYLCNVFPNPDLMKASSARKFHVDVEVYAISEMVQFLWRSALRNNEEISLYIPSRRMRILLQKWLNNEFE